MGEQEHQRSSPNAVKVLNPMSGFPAWESNKGTGNTQGIMECPLKVCIRKMTVGPLSGIYGNFVQECLVQGREGTHLAVAMGTDLRVQGSAKTSHNYCPFPSHPWLDMCVYWGRHWSVFTHETVPPDNIWPRKSGLEGQRNLIIGLSQAWGNRHSSLGRHKQDPEERNNDSTGDWSKTTCYCWRVSCGDMGGRRSTIVSSLVKRKIMEFYIIITTI